MDYEWVKVTSGTAGELRDGDVVRVLFPSGNVRAEGELSRNGDAWIVGDSRVWFAVDESAAVRKGYIFVRREKRAEPAPVKIEPGQTWRTLGADHAVILERTSSGGWRCRDVGGVEMDMSENYIRAYWTLIKPAPSTPESAPVAPPRCAHGCTPLAPCMGEVCPQHLEKQMLYGWRFDHMDFSRRRGVFWAPLPGNDPGSVPSVSDHWTQRLARLEADKVRRNVRLGWNGAPLR